VLSDSRYALFRVTGTWASSYFEH